MNEISDMSNFFKLNLQKCSSVSFKYDLVYVGKLLYFLDGFHYTSNFCHYCFCFLYQVKSPLDTGGDFIGSSQVGSFYPGGPDVVAVTFTVNDDSSPEIEETFTFELSVMSSVGTVDTPNIAAITIAANDDAYGVFKFTDVSSMTLMLSTILYH